MLLIANVQLLKSKAWASFAHPSDYIINLNTICELNDVSLFDSTCNASKENIDLSKGLTSEIIHKQIDVNTIQEHFSQLIGSALDFVHIGLLQGQFTAFGVLLQIKNLLHLKVAKINIHKSTFKI